MATATAKEESLLEAVASAEDPVDDADNNDIESQVPPTVEDTIKQEEGWIQVGSVATNLQTTQDTDTTPEDPTTSTILKDNPYKTLASTASSINDNDKPTASTKTSNNIGILSEEDDTASVFSFDSYEKRPSIPLRVQNMIQRSLNNNDGSTNIPGGNSSTVPFPSVIGSTTYNDGDVVNVCPCRCLFFTLKETICLIMSALGCAVFLAGLVLLCMYLEGSIFS